jgi:hypothetical protein
MLILNTDLPPAREIPLGGNAFITLRSATLVEAERAHAEVRRSLGLLGEGQQFMAQYGLDHMELPQVLSDGGATEGLAELITLTELVMACGTGWRGIGLTDHSPAPFDRANVARLLLDPGIAGIIRTAVQGRLHEVVAEGNGSAPSSSGEREGGATTAAGARNSGTRARGASRGKTGSGARRG